MKTEDKAKNLTPEHIKTPWNHANSNHVVLKEASRIE